MIGFVDVVNSGRLGAGVCKEVSDKAGAFERRLDWLRIALAILGALPRRWRSAQIAARFVERLVLVCNPVHRSNKKAQQCWAFLFDWRTRLDSNQ